MEARVALWAFLVSITSSIAAAQQISVVYNHSQIFSRFQTYSWRADEIKRVGQTMLSQVVRQDVDTAMQNKGLQQVHEDQTPDLIVMATHGRGAIHHLFFGSVTEAVVRNAVCPVLTLRPAAEAEPEPKAAKPLQAPKPATAAKKKSGAPR